MPRHCHLAANKAVPLTGPAFIYVSARSLAVDSEGTVPAGSEPQYFSRIYLAAPGDPLAARAPAEPGGAG